MVYIFLSDTVSSTFRLAPVTSPKSALRPPKRRALLPGVLRHAPVLGVSPLPIHPAHSSPTRCLRLPSWSLPRRIRPGPVHGSSWHVEVLRRSLGGPVPSQKGKRRPWSSFFRTKPCLGNGVASPLRSSLRLGHPPDRDSFLRGRPHFAVRERASQPGGRARGSGRIGLVYVQLTRRTRGGTDSTVQSVRFWKTGSHRAAPIPQNEPREAPSAVNAPGSVEPFPVIVRSSGAGCQDRPPGGSTGTSAITSSNNPLVSLYADSEEAGSPGEPGLLQ